jgi:hypothetical protein
VCVPYRVLSGVFKADQALAAIDDTVWLRELLLHALRAADLAALLLEINVGWRAGVEGERDSGASGYR